MRLDSRSLGFNYSNVMEPHILYILSILSPLRLLIPRPRRAGITILQ
jgi:hypothetical protein